MNQRAKVVSIPPGSPGAIDLQLTGTLLGIPFPLSRPMVGNETAGFHFQPAIGDSVITLSEMRGWASGSAGVGDPTKMPALNAGESQIIHTDGRMYYLANGTPGQVGNTTLYSDPLGNQILINAQAHSITINPTASGTLNLDGPTFLPAAAPALAKEGLLNIGSGPFDGTSSGHFTGSSAGTELAINAPAGFTGRLVDVQTAGTSQFKIDAATGLVTTAGEVSVGGELLVSGITQLNSTLDVTGAVTAHSTLDSLGAATMHSTLNVTGLATLSGTVDVAGHITTSGSTPGLSGVGAPFLGVTIAGNDTAGTVSMTGSNTVNQYQFYSVATVTFATAYPVGYTPTVVLTGNFASFVCAVSSVSRTGFTIDLTVICGTATTTFAACGINYMVIGTH